jgi:hypothetical protein
MVIIVKTEYFHLHNVAQCHAKSFPKSLATALGKKYLKVMLSWYLSTSKTFLFHLDCDGAIVGYCGSIISDGTLGTGSASGMAQHTFWSAIWAFTTHPWVFFHPELPAKWPVIRKNILVRLGLKSKNHFTKEQQKKATKVPTI